MKLWLNGFFNSLKSRVFLKEEEQKKKEKAVGRFLINFILTLDQFSSRMMMGREFGYMREKKYGRLYFIYILWRSTYLM